MSKQIEEMSLQDAMVLFLSTYDNSNTQRVYEQVVTYLLDYIGHARPVKTVSNIDLLHYASHLKERYPNKSSVYKHTKGVKRFFNWLQEVGAYTAETNPSTVLKARRVKPDPNRDNAMPDEDLAKVLEYTRYFPLKDALVRFIADTGCRAGGARTLTLDNLNLEERKARVIEKGGKKRWVYFGEDCALALTRWLQIRPKQKHAKLPYVFIHGGKTGLYTTTGVSKIIHDACVAVGVTPRRAHSLRHRKGHQLARSGVPVSIVAGVLGNTKEVAMGYYFPEDDESVRAAVLNATWGEKPVLPTEKPAETPIIYKIGGG